MGESGSLVAGETGGAGTRLAGTAGLTSGGSASAGAGGAESGQPHAGASSGGTSTGTGGSDTRGEPGTACAPRTHVTLGVRTVIPVSWPGTLGTLAGSGDFVLANLLTMTADGTLLTGEGSPCVSALPAFNYTQLIGGGAGRIDIPDSVFDTPEFPSFRASGTLTGWDTEGRVEFPPSMGLIGFTMADSAAAWPSSSASIQAVDSDNDGHPGVTAIPATGEGYAAPPASLGGTPRADRIFVAVRTAIALSGGFTSCDEAAGTATLTQFDNHVVGCQTDDGAVCDAAQTAFVDQHRTLYDAAVGTFEARILPDGATCADVRAMP